MDGLIVILCKELCSASNIFFSFYLVSFDLLIMISGSHSKDLNSFRLMLMTFLLFSYQFVKDR